ncbi:hypothetical protein XH98_28440 [Bradyrhizobium sp. CCBAU 51745]|nr:hypothetical protein [Bradyrhizobium sp. CCBAU 51745]
MQQENSKPRPNIQRATYQLVHKVAAQIEPLSKLMQGEDNPNAVDPIDTMIELLQQTVAGIEGLQARLEALEARLDDATVMNAIKSSAHG